jgi:hypothetical protein
LLIISEASSSTLVEASSSTLVEGLPSHVIERQNVIDGIHNGKIEYLQILNYKVGILKLGNPRTLFFLL